ncbi:hypothetical protein DTO164E3_6122 [Paecilomyces variotii]|nr:hypothetical protein DTO164E3_6122 [Paecilomyces variotii]KAJ9354273.1 hypothetical protein DTO027B9_4899 [Paecilomyces variotii]KAJ9363034.1 hypothetical protein DTO280E4_3069 [Paecilomyces variotii]
MVKDTIIPTTTELQKILISSSSTGPESLVSIHLDRDPFTTASYYGSPCNPEKVVVRYGEDQNGKSASLNISLDPAIGLIGFPFRAPVDKIRKLVTTLFRISPSGTFFATSVK